MRHHRFLQLCLATAALSPSHAAFVLVDDFDTGNTLNSAAVGWTKSHASNINLTVRNNPDGGGDFVGGLSFAHPTSVEGVYRAITSIPDSSTSATLFFRMWIPPNPSDPTVQHWAGLTDNNTPDEFGEMQSYMGVQGENTGGDYDLYARNGSNPTTLVKTDEAEGRWYNFWMVIDNQNNTYDLHRNANDSLYGANGGGNIVANDFGFRTPNGNAIDRFALFGNLNSSAVESGREVYFDDLYLDVDGQNLFNPVGDASFVIPEPGTMGMVFLGTAVLARTVRRRLV